MPRRIVTISYTGLDAGGGVPKFNRDLHSAFHDRECVHYCWNDVGSKIPANGYPDLIVEWEKARILNQYLLATRKLLRDDVVIVDGFWANGLEHLPYAISHSHGIWGHVTKDDVDAGKQPENPYHHAAQVTFRQRWTRLGKPLTAVSDFIAYEMRRQWGFVSTVIDNAVDKDEYRPGRSISGGNSEQGFICLNYWPRNRPVVVHGVNDRSNANKGWDHIQKIIDNVDADVFSLDEIRQRCQALDLNASNSQALCQADLVVHPSGFEGNSMFVMESLACGVPVVGYGVGYLYLFDDDHRFSLGEVIPRSERSPERTLAAVKHFLEKDRDERKAMGEFARKAAVPIETFREKWRGFVEGVENG